MAEDIRKEEKKLRKETATCDHCGKGGRNLKKCSACRVHYFCNATCQRAGWKKHKRICKLLQAGSKDTEYEHHGVD